MCSCGHFKGARRPGRLWEPALPPSGAARPPGPGPLRAGPRAPPGPACARRPRSPPPPLARLPAPRARRPLSLPITLPLSSRPRGLLSFESRESEGTGWGGRSGGRGRSEGDGSLTQSADLRGEEQMVPLTPAAERAALRAPGSGR